MQTGKRVTADELRAIEEKLNVVLPDCYRATMLDYPFSTDSFGAEAMLPNEVESVIELNSVGSEVEGVPAPFFIGSDLGEEWYFLDTARGESPVFVYELETGKHRLFDSTLNQYCDRIRTAELEIAADEKAQSERQQSKNWWEFWK